MTPTSDGRHCAACAKTVIDFTHKTDAEILAYFKHAGAAIPCGRFRNSQLARPLLPTAPVRPAQRWRGWVAAGLALWGLRAEAAGAPPAALPPRAQHPRPKLLPPAPTRQVAQRLVSGVVRDQYSQEPVARAKVRLKGSHRLATTDANGYFRLWLPARRGPHAQHVLVVQQADYVTRTLRVPLAARAARALHIRLSPNSSMLLPEEAFTTSGVPIMEVMEVVLPAQSPAARPDTLAVPAPTPRRAWPHWLRWPFGRD